MGARRKVRLDLTMRTMALEGHRGTVVSLQGSLGLGLACCASSLFIATARSVALIFQLALKLMVGCIR